MAQGYDVCFTRDAGFLHNVRQLRGSSGTKLLRVILPQQPAQPFVEVFLGAFQATDWSRYEDGDEWP